MHASVRNTKLICNFSKLVNAQGRLFFLNLYNIHVLNLFLQKYTIKKRKLVESQTGAQTYEPSHKRVSK